MRAIARTEALSTPTAGQSLRVWAFAGTTDATARSHPLRIRNKIPALVAVSVAGMAPLATLAVWQVRQQPIEGREGQLVAAVQSAHTTVDGFRAQAEAGQMREADAQRDARDALRLSRCGADAKADFCIWSTDGVGFMHPDKPEGTGRKLIGQVVTSVDEIDHSSQKIGDIIGVIDGTPA